MYHNLEPLEGSTETGDIDPLYSSQSHAFCAKVKQLFVGYGGICLAIVGVVIVAIVIGLTVHAYHRTTPDSHLHDGPVVSMKCGQVEGSLDNEAYVFKVSKQFMFFRVAPFRKRVRLQWLWLLCLSTCPCSQPSPPLVILLCLYYIPLYPSTRFPTAGLCHHSFTSAKAALGTINLIKIFNSTSFFNVNLLVPTLFGMS